MIKGNIIFFIGHINYIGGVEQWYYTIAKKYAKNNDITLVYKWCARNQLKRLRKLTKCIEYKGEDIECNKMVFCYDLSIIDKVVAKEYILTIHADYKTQNIKLKIPDKITAVYGVSNIARDAFIEVHKDQLRKLGLTVKTLYNPILLDEPKKVLKLISATRLTKEKGLKRMELLANRLNQKGISFVWLVFTNAKSKIDIDGFVYMNPQLDILGYMKEADYLVQLSDTEGFSYSINEALCLGTPLLVTDFPATKELGVEDGKNAFILKMNMSNIEEVIKNIQTKDLKGFNHKVLESKTEWDKIMDEKVKGKYKYIKPKGTEVEILKKAYYTEEDEDCIIGDTLIIETKKRLNDLIKKGYVREI